MRQRPFLPLCTLSWPFDSQDDTWDSFDALPACSCAAGLAYRAMGFPMQFFTVLFAVPRVTGYLAHWRESLVDPDTKIIRPQQDYQVAFWLQPSVCICELSSQCSSALYSLHAVPLQNLHEQNLLSLTGDWRSRLLASPRGPASLCRIMLVR